MSSTLKLQNILYLCGENSVLLLKYSVSPELPSKRTSYRLEQVFCSELQPPTKHHAASCSLPPGRMGEDVLETQECHRQQAFVCTPELLSLIHAEPHNQARTKIFKTMCVFHMYTHTYIYDTCAYVYISW